MGDIYLYKISRNKRVEWDSFDEAVVAAHNEDEARRIHPHNQFLWKDNVGWIEKDSGQKSDWATTAWNRPDRINVKCIGKASDWIEPGTIIVASYNAG